jgi:hypothetical protein
MSRYIVSCHAYRLEHEHLINPLYDIELRNVEEVGAGKEKLSLYRTNKELVIQVYFEPNFTIEINT